MSENTNNQTDPGMRLALHFANNLGKNFNYPESLKKMSSDKKAELVDKIDGPLIFLDGSNSIDLFKVIEQIAKQISNISMQTKEYFPDIPDSLDRTNISLRLWAGCIETAKTIALETRSGVNTPEDRKTNVLNIESTANNDPIYAAGVEAGFAFKKRRNQPTSFDGIPTGTRIFNLNKTKG